MLKLRESFGVKLISRDALLPIRAERLPGSRFRVSVYDPVVSTRPEAVAGRPGRRPDSAGQPVLRRLDKGVSGAVDLPQAALAEGP